MNKHIDILHKIKKDARYCKNLNWGKPRPGHPEGTVSRHIEELEKNLEKIKPKLSDIEYSSIKLLIHTHDTFKAESRKRIAITHPDSHASMAKEFLKLFYNDHDLLLMVQFHDEPYALWKQFERKGKFNSNRFQILINIIKNWDIFLGFCIVDGCTEGKSREPLDWFFNQLPDTVISKFTSFDIIET